MEFQADLHHSQTSIKNIVIGALGNIVSQLHIHIIARFENDAAWPGPVWGAGEAVPYDAHALAKVCSDLRVALS